MWSPDAGYAGCARRTRRAAVLLVAVLCAAAAGCGFRPLNAKDGGASSAQLAQIQIIPIADRIGQQLHNQLLDKLTPLGPPAKPNYVLQVQLAESKQNLAVRKDEVATRANLIVRASFQLTRTKDNKRIMSASAISANSYNILREPFATLSAENDARARAVSDLADEIRLRVSVFLEREK